MRFGSVRKAGDVHILSYERRLHHPVEDVFAAITQPDRIAEWLAAAEELDLRVGGSVALRWLNVPDDIGEWEEQGVDLDGADPSVPARGTVTKLDPPHLVEFTTDLMGVMRWELRPDGPGCVLTFTNEIELPPTAPAEQTMAGWHMHLDHLDAALAGRPVRWSTWTDDHMDEWSRIRDGYAEQARA